MKPLYKIKDFIPDPNTHKDCWQVYDIKQGGMGWVYIVYDHKFHEPLAVKTYILQTEEAKENFKKEILVWINLDRHENIAQGRFVEEIQDRLYLFLEYVSGGDLSRYIGTKLLDVKQIIKFALQFCYGMEHAVTHGIVCHRDIKPGNCLITEDKTLKITDFGLAKALDTTVEIINNTSTGNKFYSDFSKTKTGELGGTPFYMAPEQFEDIKHLDIISDIYSFGVMLYEMICGKLPFYGNTFYELKDNHIKKDIPDISSSLNEVERPLLDIVYKCMAKRPVNRYTNFTELVKVFTQIYKIFYKEKPPLPRKGEFNSIDLINKGHSLVNLRHDQEAIKCYDQVLEIEPENAAAWCYKGSVLGKINRYQEVIICCDKALEINPKFPMAWSNKGLALIRLNRNQEAIKYIDKALEIDPKYPMAWRNKGLALMNLNRNHEALKYFDKALATDKKYLLAWSDKGLALMNLNQNQQAIVCFNNILEIDPNDVNAWYNKGLAFQELNYIQEAMKCYNKILAIEPKDIPALCNKGAVLHCLKRDQEAIECLNKALEIDPKNLIALINKSTVLMNLKYIQEAINCFDKILEIDPKDALTWDSKGSALGILNHHQEAIRCYNKTLEIDPKFSRAWFNKGITLYKLSYLKEALECFEKAKELGFPQAEKAIAHCQQLIQQQEKS